MALTLHMVLTSGGLRSLLAGAMVRASGPGQRLVLLHAADDHPAATARRRFAQLQARHWQVPLISVEMPFQFPAGTGAPAPGPGPTRPPLGQSRLLLTALAHAAAWGAARVVWPVHADGDGELAARLTQRATLAADLAHLEGAQPAAVSMPLLEMTDRQLVELGAQLDVPWPLAWNCDTPGERPCRLCTPCRRRHDAFTAAGLSEP